MHKGWVRVSKAWILVDADPDEQEAVLVTPFNRFALQRFRYGLFDFSVMRWKPFSSDKSVVLACLVRPASWSSRTSPNPMTVVLRRLRIW